MVDFKITKKQKILEVNDVMEFFEKECITQKDVKEYLDNLENSYLTNIENYDDKNKIEEFYKYCNKTIENYNKINGRY